ncbi:MAG: biopolymer transporter ExbD [Planctomycetaceae bacterium]
MRVPSATSRSGAQRVNLTPLIDVIFNLIIFFLATSHFARSEPTESVDLPEATPRQNDAESPRRLTVTIAAGPRFLVGGQEQPRQVVEAMIETQGQDDGPPLELRIRSDRGVPFGEVEPLLTAAAKAAVTDVKFAVVASSE